MAEQHFEVFDSNDIEQWCKDHGDGGAVESKVCPPVSFLTEVLTEISGKADKGLSLPWKQKNGRFMGKPYSFRFRLNELTIWAGSNGTGKSMMTTQMALWFAMHREACCLASFEMAPKYTVMRLVRQLCGRNRDEGIIAEELEKLTRKIWIYDKVGRCTIAEVWKLCEFVSQCHNVKHIFLDSLMMCVGGDKDYDGQKDFVFELTQIAKKFDLHVHLIAHTKKGTKDQTDYDTKDAIKGTSSITDLAFNVFTITPNWEKTKKRYNREPYNQSEADLTLNLIKQRNGQWTGPINLWFNEEYLTYCDDESMNLPQVEIREELPY